MGSLVEMLTGKTMTKPKVREYATNAIAHHTRRLAEFQEALAIIDEVGPEKFDRVMTIFNDVVNEPTMGPGCECDSDEDGGSNAVN